MLNDSVTFTRLTSRQRLDALATSASIQPGLMPLPNRLAPPACAASSSCLRAGSPKPRPVMKLAVVAADYSVIVWWAAAMAEAAKRIAEMRTFLDGRTASVALDQDPRFRELRERLEKSVVKAISSNRSTFDDPWTDAARYVLLCDLPSWPAVTQHHAWKWGDGPQEFIAPTLDQYVAFHRPVPEDPWLLVDGYTPIAADGLLGCMTRLWSSDGRLVASGSGQGLFRRVDPG